MRLQLRRPPRWTIVVASLVLAYTLFGFFVLPRILKSQLETRLPPLLHRSVTVREVLFNPYAMSVTIRGFAVQEPDGSPLLTFEELYVNAAVLKHLRGGVHLQEVKLVQPVVGIAIEKGGRLNFADLLDQPAEPKKPDSKPLLFEVARLTLDRGAISFSDLNRPHPFRGRIEPLSFSLQGFTTEPQKNGAYDFKARLEPSTEFVWSGSISTTPLKSSGTVSIRGIDLSQFGSYTDDSTQLRIRKGILDVQARYVFDASRTPTVIQLEDASALLSQLRVDPPAPLRGDPPTPDEPLFTLDTLRLDGLSADVGAQSLRLRSIALSGGRVLARRLKDGRLELAELAKPARPAAPPARTPPAAAPAAESKPWTTTLDELKVDHFGAVWIDESLAKPARLTVDELALRIGPVSVPGDAASRFETSMRLNGEGHLSADGTAHLGSSATDVHVSLKDLAFAPFQPYAAEFVTASIARGALSLDARASVAQGRTSVSGDLQATNFSLVDTEGKELLGFDRFALGKLETDTKVTKLELVSLKGARLHYRIEPGKADNWSTLLRNAKPAAPADAIPVAAATPVPSAAPAAAASQPSAPKKGKAPESKIAIKAIAIDDLALDFTDRSISPPYVARLTQFGGRIAPFAQPPQGTTRIDLGGKLDGAKVLVAGTLKPAGKESDADVTVSLAPWNLTPTTPYGIRFAGYPVEKGKLSLDLKYKIAGRKLDASNLVVIDQLTLGDSVNSPTATHLPVKLALAILTDRAGKLQIDLPIQGSMDDPDFRFGKVIVRTVVNVLEKAATAPFALLGSLFGSSEDMSSLEFASGADELAGAEQAKLDKLAKALTERPALRLSVAGLSDPATDRAGLLQAALDDALVDARRSATPAGKQPPPDDQPLSEAERAAGLRTLLLQRVVQPREQQAAALRAAGKPVPAELVPHRDLPAEQAEALVKETFALTPEDFDALARARAEAVQEALCDGHGLDPSRVFVAAAKAGAKPERKVSLQLE
jgi:hypothetical protein